MKNKLIIQEMRYKYLLHTIRSMEIERRFLENKLGKLIAEPESYNRYNLDLCDINNGILIILKNELRERGENNCYLSAINIHCEINKLRFNVGIDKIKKSIDCLIEKKLILDDKNVFGESRYKFYI